MAVVERIVDVRWAEPPQPLHAVLEAVQRLRPGECVVMLHRREPLPLYAMLAGIGCAYRTSHDVIVAGEHVPVRVLIWRADDSAAAAHCTARA